MSLKIGKFSGGGYAPHFLLKLLFFPLLIVACGGIVSAPKQKPEVKSTSPENGKLGVPINDSISLTFSEEMNEGSVEQSFSLVKENSVTPVPGVVTATGKSATFTPTGNLDSFVVYVAKVTSGARDLSGDAMSEAFSWKFTTSDKVDATAPFVVAVNPSNGTKNVSVNIASMTVTFSKVIDQTTVVAGSTLALNHGAAVSITGWSADGKTVSFRPNIQLDFNRGYDIEIRGGPNGIKDISGNDLDPDSASNPNPNPNVNKPDTFISVFKTKAEGDND